MSAARQLFESALRAPVLRVETLGRGARRVTYIGERTARNTERDTLYALETLGLNAGLDVGVEVSRRGVQLWINPSEPPDQEAIVNDVGHPEGCRCPVCLPELYDQAEIEAGRGEKICGAVQPKESGSEETAPSGAMAWR